MVAERGRQGRVLPVVVAAALIVASSSGVEAQTDGDGDRRTSGDVCEERSGVGSGVAEACEIVNTGKRIVRWGSIGGVAATLGLAILAARTKSKAAIAAVGISGSATGTLVVVGSAMEAQGYRKVANLQAEQLRGAGVAPSVGIAYRLSW